MCGTSFLSFGPDMIHLPMTHRKTSPPQPVPTTRPADSAFDVWLNRGLHELFDDVAKEPIPEELLRLLRGDEEK